MQAQVLWEGKAAELLVSSVGAVLQAGIVQMLRSSHDGQKELQKDVFFAAFCGSTTMIIDYIYYYDHTKKNPQVF